MKSVALWLILAGWFWEYILCYLWCCVSSLFCSRINAIFNLFQGHTQTNISKIQTEIFNLWIKMSVISDLSYRFALALWLFIYAPVTHNTDQVAYFLFCLMNIIYTYCMSTSDSEPQRLEYAWWYVISTTLEMSCSFLHGSVRAYICIGMSKIC